MNLLFQNINKVFDEEEMFPVNKIELSEEIFDRIYQSLSFENRYFVQQKADIFENLVKQKIFIYKLIDSNEKGDLFIGIQKLRESSYHKQCIKIIYNQTLEQEKEKYILALDAFEYQYKTIQANENTTHIFILDKEECLQIDKKLKLYMESIQKNLNFYQFGDLFQINFENKQNCNMKQQQQQMYTPKQKDFLFCFFKHQDQDCIGKKNDEQIYQEKEIKIQKPVCQENEILAQ
ncbi:hypothetical protein ABPG72_010700 [Tetrahymena utriculariae]